MPSAISRLSDPVGKDSISTICSFFPSRMIDPLPYARSIWPSAASSAFCLSEESLSLPSRLTTFSRAMSIIPLNSCGSRRSNFNKCTSFVLVCKKYYKPLFINIKMIHVRKLFAIFHRDIAEQTRIAHPRVTTSRPAIRVSPFLLSPPQPAV